MAWRDLLRGRRTSTADEEYLDRLRARLAGKTWKFDILDANGVVLGSQEIEEMPSAKKGMIVLSFPATATGVVHSCLLRDPSGRTQSLSLNGMEGASIVPGVILNITLTTESP